MKSFIYTGLFITQIFAQDMPQINESQMQGMMAGLQEMQICMSKIDMASLQAIQTEAINTEKDIRRMCKDRQRDKAQKVAITFMKRFNHTQAISQMKACAKLSALGEILNLDEEKSIKNICDADEINLGTPTGQRIDW